MKEVVEFEEGSPSRVVRVKIARQRNHLVPPAICKSVDYRPARRAPHFVLVRMRSNEIYKSSQLRIGAASNTIREKKTAHLFIPLSTHYPS